MVRLISSTPRRSEDCLDKALTIHSQWIGHFSRFWEALTTSPKPVLRWSSFTVDSTNSLSFISLMWLIQCLTCEKDNQNYLRMKTNKNNALPRSPLSFPALGLFRAQRAQVKSIALDQWHSIFRPTCCRCLLQPLFISIYTLGQAEFYGKNKTTGSTQSCTPSQRQFCLWVIQSPSFAQLPEGLSIYPLHMWSPWPIILLWPQIHTFGLIVTQNRS